MDNFNQKQADELEENGPSEAPVPAEEKEAANDDGIMPLRVASGIGGRGGGHKVARAMTKANRLFGMGDDETELSRLEGIDPPPPPVARVDKADPDRPKVVLGSGAWAAILALVFLFPAVAWLSFQVFDLNNQIDTVKKLNLQIQDNPGQFATLYSVLNSPNLKTYQMTVVDPLPNIQANLHIGGPKTWALSVAGLNSLTDKNKILVLYAVRKVATPGPSDYISLLVFPNGLNQFGVNLVDSSRIPDNFGPNYYSQLIITDEPINQPIEGKPTGITRFSLDVSKLNLN